MSDQFFWYVTRSAALITWFASAASILVGLATSSRVLGRRPTIPWLVDLHRLFAGMAVTFLGVHMVSLWFDTFVKFRFDDLLIPWAASVPGLTRSSIAYGVISAWLIAAVQISSLMKDRLSEPVWRSIHLLSFATLALGTLHAVEAGSDVTNPIVLGVGMSMLTAILLMTIVRLLRLLAPRPEDPAPTEGRSQRRAITDPVDEPAPDRGFAPNELPPQPLNPGLRAPRPEPRYQPQASHELPDVRRSRQV